MSNRDIISRAAAQRVVHKDGGASFALTVHDSKHSPSWRCAGSRGNGEITFSASAENGVPVLKVTLVEVYQSIDRPEEVREATFEVFGTSAIEVFEAMRPMFDTGAGFVKGRVI